MDHMIELARKRLQHAPAGTAVVRISVWPAPDTGATGTVLLATLITGPAPGTRHVLGRFSLYPADRPGTFLLRLDAAARHALRERSEPPQVVLSAEVQLVSAPAATPASVASAWQVAADWLPEPRSP